MRRQVPVLKAIVNDEKKGLLLVWCKYWKKRHLHGKCAGLGSPTVQTRPDIKVPDISSDGDSLEGWLPGSLLRNNDLVDLSRCSLVCLSEKNEKLSPKNGVVTMAETEGILTIQILCRGFSS